MLAPVEARVTVSSGVARVRWSTRADGDLNADAVANSELSARWGAIAGLPVTWLDEVHGTEVVVVDAPGARRGCTADALVTPKSGVGLGIWVGDCAPVALVSHEGIVGAAHAGWRGLEAGILGAAVAVMRDLGARTFTVLVGPCIHAECYEFGSDDLQRLGRRFGAACCGTTRWGAPALDVPAAITAALRQLGIHDVTVHPSCTACEATTFWSHRARAEAGRHGMAVWMEPA